MSLLSHSASINNSIEKKINNLISHELRSTMNNILGVSNVILQNENINQKDIRELMILIRDSANKSFEILDNYINMISYQSKTPEIEKINMGHLLKEIIEFYRFFINQKGIIIKLNIQKNLEINSDKKILQFTLKNILLNAIKYSNVNGSIEIFTNSSNDFFEVEIIDHGIGMSKEKINEIFSFNNFEGMKGILGEGSTGIGLKISLLYIRDLKGELKISSKEGVGSKLTLKLPLDV